MAELAALENELNALLDLGLGMDCELPAGFLSPRGGAASEPHDLIGLQEAGLQAGLGLQEAGGAVGGSAAARPQDDRLGERSSRDASPSKTPRKMGGRYATLPAPSLCMQLSPWH